jgi:hypothetical protein
MTHDELLAKIDLKRVGTFSTENEKRRNALRVVVELHKPVISQQVKDTYPNDQKRMESEPKVCKECSDIWEMDLGVLYPCPTIQAIEKELS